MDFNEDLDGEDCKERFKKKLKSFWDLVLGLVGIVFILGLAGWVLSGISGVIKGWFKPQSAVLSSYTPPKPSRPVGLVHLTTTGEEKKSTEWYLRADTVLGPRTKRLFWVYLDYNKDKSEKDSRTEMFLAVNCETMEMRELSSASYKSGTPSPSFSVHYAFDKAKVEYPIPRTGMMASYNEVCKEVYDTKS